MFAFTLRPAEAGFRSLKLKPASLAPGFSGCSKGHGDDFAEPEARNTPHLWASPNTALSEGGLMNNVEFAVAVEAHLAMQEAATWKDIANPLAKLSPASL